MLLISLNVNYAIWDISTYRFLQRGTKYGNFLVSDAEGKSNNMNFNKSYDRKR